MDNIFMRLTEGRASNLIYEHVSIFSLSWKQSFPFYLRVEFSLRSFPREGAAVFELLSTWLSLY